MGKCVLFLLFYASSSFLLRTEKPGIEDDWEQIDARDIGENNWGLSKSNSLDLFYASRIFICRTKKWDGRMIGSRSLLGIVGRTSGTFESKSTSFFYASRIHCGKRNLAEVYYWEQIGRERKIGDDRILRRNQTPLTQQFIAGIEDR